MLSMVAFTNSLSPYVTFAAAKTSKGTVQILGTLAGKATSNGKTLHFKLQDGAGEEAAVVYTGTKPEGFEQASQIVVVGKYQNSQFIADRLLVKCPSKYQGGGK
jgi:cytochrome c-type biogenesis protein CcmE